MNTANEGMGDRKLKAIPEMPDEHAPVRDLSSSEKLPKIPAKLLNDTILEEQESYIGGGGPEDMDIPQSQEGSEYASFGGDDRHGKLARRGILSKLSKKMARDFEENKKSFSRLSNQSLSQLGQTQLIAE